MQQRIIIVGSTSGMGRRMAEIYMNEGHKVGATGRRAHLLAELKERYPQLAETECWDITGPENVPRLESLIEKLGGLDILIISAGFGDPSRELIWELDKKTVNTNVNGFVEIANWTYKYFEKKGTGHLAVISSVASARGNSWAPAYSGSKAFQSVYFEGLAMKARKTKRKIALTCIEPGFVNTKMAKGNKRFWLVAVDKAARQIIRAIQKKKRKVYISRRWVIISKLMKAMPYWIYKRLG